MIQVGFIGTGNMGGALATAAANSDKVQLWLSNQPIKIAQNLANKIGGTVCDNNLDVVKNSHYLFLGVKPQNLREVAEEIRDAVKLNDNLIIVSMLAGKSMKIIESSFNINLPIIRLMPNLPAMVQEGMILYTHNDRVSAEKMACFLDFMSSAGRFVALEESLFSAGSGVSGCGPAFAAMFIEALADGGVDCGLPRATAIELAAQMVKGTAEYILQTGIHPDQLKDMVCSPGGTTIEGVRALEQQAFRSSLIEAVNAAYQKDLSL